MSVFVIGRVPYYEGDWKIQGRFAMICGFLNESLLDCFRGDELDREAQRRNPAALTSNSAVLV